MRETRSTISRGETSGREHTRSRRADTITYAADAPERRGHEHTRRRRAGDALTLTHARGDLLVFHSAAVLPSVVVSTGANALRPSYRPSSALLLLDTSIAVELALSISVGA